MSGSPGPRKMRWKIAAAALVAFATMWIIGPAPIRSGAYVHSVTTGSAVIARIDRTATLVRVSVQPATGAGGVVEQAETEATRFHNLTVEGLKPGTAYRYVIEGGDAEPEEGEFRTPPDDDRTPIRFAAVGDTGKTPWWFRYFDRFGWTRARPVLSLLGGLKPQWEVAHAMTNQDVDMLVHLGDIVYPDGQLSHYEEAFFLPFEHFLRTAAVFPVLGNHDLWAAGGESYFTVFHAGAEQHNYTFVWGGVRFVMVNDHESQELGAGSLAAEWLEETLSQSTEPWLIVALHEPVFCSSRYSDNERLKKDLWPLLVRHRVDVVLAGHSHNYQRFKPIDGITQVISGAGGHSIYSVKPDERLAMSSEDYGVLIVEVAGAKLTGEFFNLAGEIGDRFTIELTEGRLPGESPRAERLRALLN